MKFDYETYVRDYLLKTNNWRVFTQYNYEDKDNYTNISLSAKLESNNSIRLTWSVT